jgi:hypothetical protein
MVLIIFVIPSLLGISYEVGLHLSEAKTIALELALEFALVHDIN